jgi:hypothetical protein
LISKTTASLLVNWVTVIHHEALELEFGVFVTHTGRVAVATYCKNKAIKVQFRLTDNLQ